MTIASQTRTAGPFSGTGLVVSYPFAFKVFQTSDVLVTQTDAQGNVTTPALGGGYTVTLNSDQNTSPGGIVTPLAAVPVGTKWLLSSSVSLTQGASLTNAGGFFPKSIEDALDRLTILLQQQTVSDASTLRVPELGALSTLPAASQRASQLVGFDSVGNAVLYAPGAVSMNIVSQPKSEMQTLSVGQTLVTLATFTYPSAKANAITVFLDGQEINDFTQTSDSSLTLTTAPSVPHQITVTTNTFSSFGSGKTNALDSAATSADVGSYQFRRNVNYSGGGVGVNGCVRADTYVNNASATTFEWTGIFVMHNNAAAGENVGVYGQGNMLNTGSTWGAVAEACDMTYTSSAGKAGLIGLEVDCYVNDADPSGNRVGIQVICGDAHYNRTGVAGVAGTVTNGVILEAQAGGTTNFTNGLVINSAVSAGVVVNTTNSVSQAFRVQNHADIGLDTTLATIGIAAVRVALGQSIAFTAAGTRQLSYDGTGFQFNNPPGSASLWTLSDNGTLVVQGKQLLSAAAQQAGWVKMTGSLDHTTAFAVGSVTTAQLASRVAALELVAFNMGQIAA